LQATCKSIAPAGEVRRPGLVQPTQDDILSERQAEVIRGLVQARLFDAMWKRAGALK
jgi:hypothetical protein